MPSAPTTSHQSALRLKLGDAFDVTANKVQTDFTRISDRVHAYRVTLKNAKREAATVQVREPIPGDWEILAGAQAYEACREYGSMGNRRAGGRRGGSNVSRAYALVSDQQKSGSRSMQEPQRLQENG